MINKRKQGKMRKWIVLIVVLAVACGGVLYFLGRGGFSSSPAGDSQRGSMGVTANASSSGTGVTQGSYSTVSRGSIEVSVSGTGNISPAASETLYSYTDGKVEKVYAAVGDHVKAGDVVVELSSDALESEIATLESTLFEAQLTLSEIRDSGSGGYIYAPASGVVRMTAVEADDDVSIAMKTTGYLCVISRDGKMKIDMELPDETELSIGDGVNVMIGATQVAGVLDDISGTTYSFTIADDEDDPYAVGAQAVVSTTLGRTLGAGTLQINMPVPVTGVGGAISKVYKEDGDVVSSGATLFSLTGRVPSAALQKALLAYEEAKVNLDNAKDLHDSLTIRAGIDGVITEMDAIEGKVLEENATAFVVQSDKRFKLVATVDELDIAGVEVGQTAQIELDAYEGQTFNATVTGISGIGTVSGGVATYEVTLLLDEAEGLMDGMTASADIVIADKSNVLVVPVEAISTSNGQKYVTLSTGATSNVTTGVTDDTNIEILSGVSEGDSVLITRTTSDSSSSGVRGSSFGGMGGGMPSGGMGGGMPGGF